jgi:hypothetical protein
MSERTWLRTCELSLEAEGATFKYEGVPGNNEEGFRIRFQIWRDWLQACNFADITVTNPNRQKAHRIASQNQEGKKVRLKVGYQGQMQGLFVGNIIQVRYGRESTTDTYLNITARDGGTGYDHAYVNKTLPANSTGEDVFKAISSSFEEYGVSKGFASETLKKFKFERPVVLVGQAKDNLRWLGRSTGTLWSVQNEKLQMLPPKEHIPGEAVVINAKTGMIGQPEQLAKYIIVRSLINPKVEINHRIHLDNASILLAQWDLSIGGASPGNPGPKNAWLPQLDQDGFYKVFKIDYIGDTRGNSWYMDLYCVGQNESPLPGTGADYGGSTPHTLYPVGG